MNSDEPTGSNGGLNAPWSENTPYARGRRSRRDPVLDKLIQAEGRGKVNPYGFRRDASIRAVGKAANNPYLNLFQAALGIFLGAFIAYQLRESVWAWVVGGVFGLLSLAIVVYNLYRAPAWHRARRVAKAYVAEHGGSIPDELRLLF